MEKIDYIYNNEHIGTLTDYTNTPSPIEGLSLSKTRVNILGAIQESEEIPNNNPDAVEVWKKSIRFLIFFNDIMGFIGMMKPCIELTRANEIKIYWDVKENGYNYHVYECFTINDYNDNAIVMREVNGELVRVQSFDMFDKQQIRGIL